MPFKKSFSAIYRKIKLMIYKSMFKRIKDNGETLTSTEYLCLECIYLLDKPSVTEFAEFLDISAPNATYKVRTLIQKGFIRKEKSPKDGREYLLVPTEKFFEYFENKNDKETIDNVKKSLDNNQNKKFEKILNLLED